MNSVIPSKFGLPPVSSKTSSTEPFTVTFNAYPLTHGGGHARSKVPGHMSATNKIVRDYRCADLHCRWSN
eukprot:gene5286-15463_t